MLGSNCLGIRLNVPFWCSFRDPLTTNIHRTYPVPPPSTLYGLLAAAFGLEQDDQSLRREVRFAVAIDTAGEVVESYSKWMKGAEAPKDRSEVSAREEMRRRGLLTPDEAVWISAPIIRQKLIQPKYTVGILCSEAMGGLIVDSLTRPAFPLYLGESDDVVDVEILGYDAPIPSNDPATGTVTGVHAGAAIMSLPCCFFAESRGRWSVTRWLVSVPSPGRPINADNSDVVACHGHVWTFEPAIEAELNAYGIQE